ncbi:MAG: hypothetical protein KIS92_16090 [Planctomycetota bacterium]|nr:hypothetical protein [Planctomycetota bacterium]
MRQALIASFLMLAGVVLATVIAFQMASHWRSISHYWLMIPAFLPSIGVATGAWLSHKRSKGEDPFPIQTRGRYWAFVLLGALGSALSGYLVYIAISSAWFETDIVELIFDPSKIREYTETGKYGSHSASVGANTIMGFVIGTIATARLIREKLID